MVLAIAGIPPEERCFVESGIDASCDASSVGVSCSKKKEITGRVIVFDQRLDSLLAICGGQVLFRKHIDELLVIFS